MTPSDVKRYLAARKVAPLTDIATHFDLNPDAVRGLLDVWIRKGKVKQISADASCCTKGSCSGCSENGHQEIYEWVQ